MRKMLALMLILMLIALPATAQDDTFSLTIIHTNDTHAAHAPNRDGNGGVAILAAVINQIRAATDNTLLVDAGDRFTGTLFHTQYRGQDQVMIMNLLGYQAMALGNHEFDNGDQVLADFISGVNFPVLAANLTVDDSSPLTGMIEAATVVEAGGEKIGIIGLVTADTAFSSSPSDAITFNVDYAAAANAAAAELAAQGINKIILLTHTGIQVDDAFMGGLSGIDVVIGGHSHTLLSNTYRAAAERYPLEVMTSAGETVYYAQAGANTQYVGELVLEFDADGNIVDAGGDTIFLSRFISPDPDAADLIAELRVEVDALGNQPIGATVETLLVGDRTVCRVEECNLGNLIADAMRADTGAQIAIMNGGGVRANIEPGEVTLGHVLTVHPFGNLLSTFEATGATIVAALENGVSGLQVEGGVLLRDGAPGRFPQVSGLRYSFDPNLEPGSRVTSVEVLGEDGTYAPIDSEAIYSVATLNFIRTGGDGYSMFANDAIDPYDFGRLDYEATSEFLITNSPINYAVEGRIMIENVTIQPLTE